MRSLWRREATEGQWRWNMMSTSVASFAAVEDHLVGSLMHSLRGSIVESRDEWRLRHVSRKIALVIQHCRQGIRLEINCVTKLLWARCRVRRRCGTSALLQHNGVTYARLLRLGRWWWPNVGCQRGRWCQLGRRRACGRRCCRGDDIRDCLLGMGQESQGREPQVMSLGRHGSELECPLRRQDEYRSVENLPCPLGRRIVILDVQD